MKAPITPDRLRRDACAQMYCEAPGRQPAARHRSSNQLPLACAFSIVAIKGAKGRW